MASRPVLYSMPISHYWVCADRTLAFKGVSFDTKYVPYHDKRALIKATGQDYVPTLVWDGKPVMWHDISDCLEREHPKPTLYPWGQKGLAATLENWGHQVLEERVWRYVVTKVPPVLRDDHERWVFEEMQTRARGPWHVLEMRRGGGRGGVHQQPRRGRALPARDEAVEVLRGPAAEQIDDGGPAGPRELAQDFQRPGLHRLADRDDVAIEAGCRELHALCLRRKHDSVEPEGEARLEHRVPAEEFGEGVGTSPHHLLLRPEVRGVDLEHHPRVVVEPPHDSEIEGDMLDSVGHQAGR